MAVLWGRRCSRTYRAVGWAGFCVLAVACEQQRYGRSLSSSGTWGGKAAVRRAAVMVLLVGLRRRAMSRCGGLGMLFVPRALASTVAAWDWSRRSQLRGFCQCWGAPAAAVAGSRGTGAAFGPPRWNFGAEATVAQLGASVAAVPRGPAEGPLVAQSRVWAVLQPAGWGWRGRARVSGSY